MSTPLSALQELQREAVELVAAVSEKDIHQQFHPDLSPIGWHLGHCVYMETHWIREVLLDTEVDAQLKKRYLPELSIKSARGQALPDKNELMAWAARYQAENLSLLASVKPQDHRLLQDDYLYHFLINHYAQHIETMLMVLTEKNIQHHHEQPEMDVLMNETALDTDTVSIAGGDYEIGVASSAFGYDNERPKQQVTLETFNLSASPVTNGTYLGFMNDGGYCKPACWSDASWAWREKHHITHPNHWKKHQGGGWYGIDHAGPCVLDAAQPVHGLSHHEALAFARWAGGRLPHEYEWEVACQAHTLQHVGSVWEWCSNPLHPYPGFQAYPYDGYSTPYFDDDHYVLRGGSFNTKVAIRRSSFRNYYQPDKRHIFAGIRLIRD